jgi:hypothetical protein
LGLHNERSALRVLHSAASQLTHPQETTIEDDVSLLKRWHTRMTSREGEGEEDFPTRRMIAAVQFRMQRKQAVSMTRRVAAGELDALSATSGGWNP